MTSEFPKRSGSFYKPKGQKKSCKQIEVGAGGTWEEAGQALISHLI